MDLWKIGTKRDQNTESLYLCWEGKNEINVQGAVMKSFYPIPRIADWINPVFINS